MRALQEFFVFDKLESRRQWFLGTACVLVSLLVSSVTARAQASSKMRWDIVSVDTTTTPLPTVNPGGSGVAVAADSTTTLTLTGTGTFRTLPSSARFSAFAIDGSGTWQTCCDTSGNPTGSGSFTVRKGPAFFVEVSGTLTGVTDSIGDLTDAHAGFLIVEIMYADGDRGVLGVACAIKSSPPASTDSPATAFEGVIATKGVTQFLTISSGATLFHVVPPPFISPCGKFGCR